MSNARPIGEAEAAIARRQHGVVTRRQLRDAGFSGDVIDHRIRTGRLTRIHRGVFLVGVVAPAYAYEWAACLACGPGAVISHWSAGVLWQIVVVGANRRIIEVTIRNGYRRRPGLRVHRMSTLGSDEVTRLNGVPVTTPARTLYDLASRLARRPLERAVAEAIALELTTVSEVRATAERHTGRRGAARLRSVVGSGEPQRTRSEAEERFLVLVRRSGIEPPAVNSRVGGHEIDFYWSEERLAVEVDGFAFHASPRAFERDRRRDAELATLGIRVVRVTWKQITEEPETIILRLKGALEYATGAASAVPTPEKGSRRPSRGRRP